MIANKVASVEARNKKKKIFERKKIDCGKTAIFDPQHSGLGDISN